MNDNQQKLGRRAFLGDALRVAGAWASAAQPWPWQHARDAAASWSGRSIPAKCIACGNCATYCVLDDSAVKCVHSFVMCGYCDLCTGYFRPAPIALNSGAENQLCPTGAIQRAFVEDPYHEYTIDERLCIGCGKCVKGCNAFGNGSLYLQVRHDRCQNCNECAIAVACPSQAYPPRAGRRSVLVESPGAAGMRCCKRVLMLLIVASIPLAVSQTQAAVERFPPPDFTDHKLPVTTVPPPRAEFYQYVDLAALVAALCGASYLAIVKRSRRGLFVLAIASLAWLGFWRGGCICPVGSIQNVTLALFDPAYALPWTVAVIFTLPIIFTLFFGRTFCAAVCPLGAVQELVALRPVGVPVWLDHALGLLRYVYLGAGVLFAATGSAFVVCRYDPFVGFFRHSASANMLILGACFLVGGIFVGRPYCRYLCPYGAILGIVSRWSKWHVQNPARAVHPVPAVRGCLPVRRHPRADRRAAAHPAPHRPPASGGHVDPFSAADRRGVLAGPATGSAAGHGPPHGPAGRPHPPGADGPRRGHDRHQRRLPQHGPHRPTTSTAKRLPCRARFAGPAAGSAPGSDWSSARN